MVCPIKHIKYLGQVLFSYPLAIVRDNESETPKYAEPWFLTFNADVQFNIAMTPDDLQNAGLDKLVKNWSKS